MSTARANRPIRDKPNKSQATENTNSEQQGSTAKNQPTPEQMRLAQMITTESNKGEDPVIKAKIQQVIELTGRSENEALFALYDVNYDLNRAVEKLLESADSQNEWQEISKKKKAQPTVAKVEPVVNAKPEGKREKSKDREVERSERSEPRSRRDRGPPRFQRGRGRDRGNSDDKFDNDRHKPDNASGERNFERTERGGRGRGRGGGAGRGRGRGRGTNFRGTRFDQSKDKGPHIDTWTNEQAQTAEKENIGSWGDMTEDWTADEWQGSLEETKVFTASSGSNDSNVYTSSSVQNDSSVFSSSMHDNDAKMFTPPPPSIEAQVYTATSITNSSISPTLNDSTNTFQHGASPLQQNSLPPPPQGTIGHNSLAQSSLAQNSLGQNSLGQRLDLGALFPKTAESPVSLSQQQSQFMSQFTKEATESIKNAVGIGSSAPGHQASVAMSSGNDTNRNLVQSGQTSNNQRSKPQRTRLPPPSKIPASAVEMPGGMNFQLDVQFGNLDYPSTLPDSNTRGLAFGSPVNSTGTISNNYTPAPVSVTPTKPQSSTGISSLDSLSQSNSQSPRGSGGVFPPPNNSTPPKDYTQSSMGKQSMPSPPENLQYPSSQERKASPYGGQRSVPAPGTLSSNKPASSPMTFSQSSYSSSYQSSTYKPTAHTSSSSTPSVSTSPPSSFSHTTNGLTAGGLSSHPSGLQGQNQYNSTGGYQSSSFQNTSGFSSSNQGQGSLYQNSTNQSNSYSPQTGGSTSFSSGSGSGSGSSYQNQSGSYQNQATGGYPSQSYSSRDTRESRESSHAGQSGSSAYQSGGASQQPGASYQASVTQSSSVSSSSSTSYQRDSQSGSQSGYGHQSYAASSQNAHQNSLSGTNLSDSIGKISISDSTSLDGPQSAQYDHVSSSASSASLTTTTSTTSSSQASGSVGVSASLGLTNTTASTTASPGVSKNTQPVSSKAPPNLPPGVPLIQNYMTIGQPGIAPFAFASLGQQPFYSYEDLQVLQQRIPLLGHSYDMPLQPATTLPGRDQNTAGTLATTPFSSTGAENKLSRVDAQSPVNAQTSQQQPTQPGHQQQQQQQAFLNPTALPPGYNYYYPTGGVLPGGYSYPPTMFPVPSVTNAAHGGSTGSVQFQKPGGYGSHAYGSAGQSQDFTKGYSSASTAQNKVSSGTMAVSSASDLTGTGTNYGKTHTQSFDKAGFHAGTPPPFNLPLPAGTQAGPMGAPTAYGAQYVPVMTHQPHSHQPHSQMLHHPLQQESAGGSARATQQTATQNKGPVNKTYSTYWGAN